MANAALEWATPANIREVNKRAVINLVRRKKTISQAELSRRSSLSKAAISAIVKDLQEQGLIMGVGQGKSAMGRKPTLLALNPDGGYIIGVDFDLDRIEMGIIDIVNNIKFRREIPIDPSKSVDSIFSDVFSSLNGLIQDSEIPRSKLLGIGVCLPGVVNDSDGVATEIRTYHWNNVPVRDIVETHMNIPTSVDTSAMARCLAEQYFGNGQGVQNFIYAKVSGGVGVTFMLDGRVVRNHINAPDGLAHQEVTEEASVVGCSCGKKGCLQSVASGQAILGEARHYIEQQGKTLIRGLVNNDGGVLKIGHIFIAAEQKDAFALDLIERVSRALGRGLASIADLLGMDKVIMSGIVIEQSRGLLVGKIEEYSRLFVAHEGPDELQVVETDMHENIGLLSTAAVVHKNMFGKVVN